MFKRNAVLARNVLRLIQHHGIALGNVSAGTGLTPRELSVLVDPKCYNSIQLETVVKLAQYFDLKPFQLLIPNLPMNYSQSCKVTVITLNGGCRKIVCATKKRSLH